MKKKCVALLLAMVLIPSVAVAASFETGDRLSLTVPVLDDIYAAGEQVILDAPVEGDVFVAGGEVELKGEIADDIMGAAGRLVISGTAQDDVRVVGGEVDIQGTIEDDLIVAGGSVRIFDSAVIKGNVVVAGGEVRIDGTIDGSLLAAGGRVVMNGTVGQAAKIHGGAVEIDGSVAGPAVLVADEIILGSNATFTSPVEYWTATGEMDFGDAEATFVSDLGRDYEEYENIGSEIAAALTGFFFFSGLLLVLLLVLAKRWFNHTADVFEKDMWKSFGVGILTLIAIPILMVLLLISIIGIPLAFFLFVSYGMLWYFSTAITALVAAALWEKKAKGTWGRWKYVAASILIYAVIFLIYYIPFIGALASAIAFACAIGALTLQKVALLKK